MARLSDHVDLLTGFPFKSARYSDDGADVRLLRGDNVAQGRLRWASAKRWPRDNLSAFEAYLLGAGDVILAMDRPWIDAGLKFARIRPSDCPSLLVQRVACLRARETLDQSYLYWLLASREFTNHVLGVQTGTAVPHISGKQIGEFEFSLPDLTEQRAIAQILDSLDNKIQLNERMNATLDEMARALFKSWFVDFDPVRAKAEGRQPSHMDAATASLFPDSFEDSVLGPIPMGWRVSTVEELADVNGWVLGKKDELDIIDYIEISEVSRGNIGQVQRYARGSEPSRARRRLRHGDTALSTVRPDRGAYFLALDPEPTLVASTGFAVLSPSLAPWSYVHAAMTQDEVSERLGHLADGAAYPAVRAEVVGETPLTWGGQEIAGTFHETVAHMYELAAMNRNESRTLGEMRDALLPRLISGELRVGDAARAVEVTR